MNDNPLLAAALDYAERGWRVVAMHRPLPSGRCGCGNRKCKHIGKHPRWHKKLLTNGVKSASSDPEMLRHWWSLWPDANVGIAMGASGLVALDEDPRNGGDLSHLHVSDEELHTLTCISGGGGRHLVYTLEPHQVLDHKKSPPGIDLLWANLILVAPPSLHLSGKRYGWAEGLGPDDGVLAPLPPALVALLQKEATPAAARSAAVLPDTISEGGRNSTLTSLAGSMRRRGMSQTAIEAALLAENSARCRPWQQPRCRPSPPASAATRRN